MAFQGNSGVSRGTALSMARRYHECGMIRENSKLKKVPIAYEIRDIFFGNKERLCISIPWGDWGVWHFKIDFWIFHCVPKQQV